MTRAHLVLVDLHVQPAAELLRLCRLSDTATIRQETNRQLRLFTCSSDDSLAQQAFTSVPDDRCKRSQFRSAALSCCNVPQLLTSGLIQLSKCSPCGRQHRAAADEHAVDVEDEGRGALGVGCTAAEAAMQQR